MARILGNILQKNKKIYIALTTLYGIGIQISLNILKKININPNTLVFNLTRNNFFEIHTIIEQDCYKILGELKQNIKIIIQNLININIYRGKRYLKNLPVRGQRTKTNSRTVRKLIKLLLIK